MALLEGVGRSCSLWFKIHPQLDLKGIVGAEGFMWDRKGRAGAKAFEDSCAATAVRRILAISKINPARQGYYSRWDKGRYGQIDPYGVFPTPVRICHILSHLIKLRCPVPSIPILTKALLAAQLI